MSADRPIGEAYIHPDNPSRVFVSITDGRSPAPTTVRGTLLRQDGPAVQLGSFAMRDGRADWGARTEVNSRTLAGAQLTTDRGPGARDGHPDDRADKTADNAPDGGPNDHDGRGGERGKGAGQDRKGHDQRDHGKHAGGR
jgi:hypothetical protein